VSGLKSSHFLAHILCDHEFVWAHFQRDWAQIVCDGLTPVRPDARTELVSVRTPRNTGKSFYLGGENIGLPLTEAEAGTSSCITSQCSATLPPSSLNMSTAIIGFGPHPT
jgi:hypothetical protein